MKNMQPLLYSAGPCVLCEKESNHIEQIVVLLALLNKNTATIEDIGLG